MAPHIDGVRNRPAPKAAEPTERPAALAAQNDESTAAADTTAPPASTAPAPQTPDAAPSGDFPTLSAERQQEIDNLVQQQANETVHDNGLFGLGAHDDQKGGENIALALTGDSEELGQLTGDERGYLAQQAYESWRDGGNLDAWNQAQQILRPDSETGVAGNPQALTALNSAAIADVGNREAESVARGETSVDYDRSRFDAQVILDAAQHDPAAVVEAFEGAETRLGVLASEWSSEEQAPLLGAVADGLVDPEAARPMVETMLVQAFDNSGMRDYEWYQNMGGALGAIYNPGDGAADQIRRDDAVQRLQDIMQPGSHMAYMLLDGDRYPPELRLALAQEMATNSDFTAESVADGWESQVVSEWMAEAANEQYGLRGAGPEALSGEALRNYVGQALGITPDNLPADGDESWMDEGINHQFYSADNEAINQVVNALLEANGGTEPVNVSLVPVTVTRDGEGAMTVPVFRVETAQGTQVVDHQGSHYHSVSEWEQKNDLPSGKMTYAEGLDLSSDRLVHANTPDTSDTPWEHFRDVGNFIAAAAGVAALGVAVVGTGGTAGALLLAGGVAAGGWQAYQVGADMADRADKGHDVFDLSDPTSRGQWLELVAAGATGVGGFGALVRGGKMGVGLARTLGATTVVGNAADMGAMANQVGELYNNWDSMTEAERANAMLGVAFWGGMTAVGAKAGGGRFTDMLSFRATANQLQNGTPYALETVDDLGSGVRIRHEEGPLGGRTYTIEAGPNASREDIMFHSTIAAQMERTTSLTGRLQSALGLNGDAPAPGTAAWEASFELGKIDTEMAALADRAATTDDPVERASIAARMDELEDSLNYQQSRIEDIEADPQGWVGKPSTGNDLAQRAGLDLDALIADYNANLPEGAAPLDPAHYTFVRTGDAARAEELMAASSITPADLEGVIALQRHDLDNAGDPVARMTLVRDGESGAWSIAPPPDRGNQDPLAVREDAVAGWNGANGDTATQAFAAIAAVRADSQPPITDSAGGPGTVAVVVGPDGKPIVGLNSTNYDADSGLALQRDWAERMGYDPVNDAGARQTLFHAEADALIRLYESLPEGQQMPTDITLYTDNDPCGYSCRNELGRLAEEMQIENLRIEVSNGSIYELQDGKIVEVSE